MEIEIKSFDDVMAIINFIIRSNFNYNPYTAYVILKQNPDVSILKSVFGWSFLNGHINAAVVPITVPLPVAYSAVKIDGEYIDILNTDISIRQKVLTGDIKTQKSIEYCHFDMFDVYDTDFPEEMIDSLFDSPDISFDSTEIVPTIKLLLDNYNIKISEKNLTLLGLDSFCDINKNQIYVETMTPQALIGACASFIFAKTTTKSEQIKEFEAFLTIYILFYMLSFNFSGELRGNLEKAYMECASELDFFESVTRVIRVCFFYRGKYE